MAVVRLRLPRGDDRARGVPLGPPDPDRVPLRARGLRHHRGPVTSAKAEAMTISEPMTLVTDYLLGGVTAWLWFSLQRNSEAQYSRFGWRMAFLALAVGAF